MTKASDFLPSPYIGMTELGTGAIPGNGGSTNVEHGVGSVPASFEVRLRCTTEDLGWMVGTEVPVAAVLRENNTGSEVTGLYYSANDTYVTGLRGNSSGSLAMPNTSGILTNITTTSWELVYLANTFVV